MAAPGLPGPTGVIGMPQNQAMHPQQGTAVNINPQHPHANPGNPPQAPVANQIDTDPISKFKNLLPKLKESLGTLFKVGGNLFYQNASQDETGRQMDKQSGKFEESLEEFYTICDHIEIQLRLSQEILQQDKDSKTNTPIAVIPQKNDAGQPEGQLYSQYISTVRAQISCAKEIRDLLHDGLKSAPEHPHP